MDYMRLRRVVCGFAALSALIARYLRYRALSVI
jgi:hypothetical protein